MKLVAIVGADGTGKTTQANLLARRLHEQGFSVECVRPVFLLFDPWRLRGAREADAALSPRLVRLRASGTDADGRRRASAFAAATTAAGFLYAVATYLWLRTAFRGRQFVVCDRYFYQFFFDLSGPSAAGLAKAFPQPDLVFWLDGDLDLIRSRSDAPPTRPSEVDYYESALAFYRELAPGLGFVRIDARMGAEEVSGSILRILMERIGA